MQTSEPKLPESSHALQLWPKSLETPENPKTEDMPDKTKDNEATQQSNHPIFWNFYQGNDTLRL